MAECVGVVVPTQNRPAMTAEAVRSVADQTYNDWRLVVVDNGSAPANRKDLHALLPDDPRVWVAETDEAVGPQHARQIGLDFFDNPTFVALLDSDDLWHPEKLETQLILAESYAQAGAVTCGHVWERPDGTVRIKRPGRSGIAPLLTNNMSTPLFRAEALLAAGGFAPSGLRALRTCEHIEFWVRFMTSGSYVVAEERTMVRCREHHAERASDGLGTREAADELAWVLEHHRSAMQHNAGDLSLLEWRVGKRYLNAGDRSRGTRHAARALASWPRGYHRTMLRQIPFVVRSLAGGRSK